jgi:hypothetical protein
MKSLAIDHVRDGEVMLAYGMNGAQLPLLNGFPLRLIVQGWYSTYWVKMLNDIEVLDRPDTNFWMATAYTIPDTPHASVRPGETGFKLVPISRMVPRSFITNIKAGDALMLGAPTLLAASRALTSPATAASPGSKPNSARMKANTASASGKPASSCRAGDRRC